MKCEHCKGTIRSELGTVTLFNVAPFPVKIHSRCYDAGVWHYGSEEAYENRVRDVMSARKEVTA